MTTKEPHFTKWYDTINTGLQVNNNGTETHFVKLNGRWYETVTRPIKRTNGGTK